MKNKSGFKELTPKDFEELNKHLLKQGGKIIQSNGSLRVETEGDKTLIQQLRAMKKQNDNI